MHYKRSIKKNPHTHSSLLWKLCFSQLDDLPMKTGVFHCELSNCELSNCQRVSDKFTTMLLFNQFLIAIC